jgi:hypothetical protein
MVLTEAGVLKYLSVVVCTMILSALGSRFLGYVWSKLVSAFVWWVKLTVCLVPLLFVVFCVYTARGYGQAERLLGDCAFDCRVNVIMGVYDPSENFLQAVHSLMFRLSPLINGLSSVGSSDLFQACYLSPMVHGPGTIRLNPRELTGRCEAYMSSRYALLSYQPVGQLKLYETVNKSTCNVSSLGLDYENPQTKFHFHQGCGYEDDSRWSIIAIGLGLAQKHGIAAWTLRPTSAFLNFDYGFTVYNDVMYTFEYVHILFEIVLRSWFK